MSASAPPDVQQINSIEANKNALNQERANSTVQFDPVKKREFAANGYILQRNDDDPDHKFGKVTLAKTPQEIASQPDLASEVEAFRMIEETELSPIDRKLINESQWYIIGGTEVTLEDVRQVDPITANRFRDNGITTVIKGRHGTFYPGDRVINISATDTPENKTKEATLEGTGTTAIDDIRDIVNKQNASEIPDMVDMVTPHNKFLPEDVKESILTKMGVELTHAGKDVPANPADRAREYRVLLNERMKEKHQQEAKEQTEKAVVAKERAASEKATAEKLDEVRKKIITLGDGTQLVEGPDLPPGSYLAYKKINSEIREKQNELNNKLLFSEISLEDQRNLREKIVEEETKKAITEMGLSEQQWNAMHDYLVATHFNSVETYEAILAETNPQKQAELIKIVGQKWGNADTEGQYASAIRALKKYVNARNVK